MNSTYVFKTKSGKLFLQRCPKCERENYAPAVAFGICAWCGYEAKDEDVDSHEEGAQYSFLLPSNAKMALMLMKEMAEALEDSITEGRDDRGWEILQKFKEWK